jgi:molybdate transport system regulatory protein
MSKAPTVRFRIDFENDSNVGPGKIALLETIREKGSLAAAARTLGMSYRRAWLLVESLNNAFEKPTTINTTGGTGGGGAVVTEFGLLLIERYRELDHQIRDSSETCLKDILPHLARPSAKSRKVKPAPLARHGRR